MTVEIRSATSADITAIAAVVREVWEQTIEVDACHSQIKDDACAIWVAVEDGAVAGFVSAFLTVGKNGIRRWEVDLLAVKSAGRGQQLGQKLVEATWPDAQRQRINIARAAIRVDNIASQRTFERAGYATDGQVYKLFVWSPEPADTQLFSPENKFVGQANSLSYKIAIPQAVILLPVDTVTYRGLWLEGLAARGVSEDEQRQTVATARALTAEEGRMNTGAMMPVADEVRLADDLRLTAVMLGEYHSWQKHSGER